MTSRLIPATESELRAAIEAGSFDESHYSDVKTELAPKESGNKKLAIDLASFAVDGGMIAVGVAEKETKELIPIPLVGLKERVDQIGRSRLDPPLAVTCREIEAEGTPGVGYLVIAIPASPDAPHMVEHIYRGRGDTTNIQLSDAEVRRIRAQRAEAQFDIRDVLATEIERDPFDVQARELGHLFIVAEPVYAPPELLVSIAGQEWRKWLFDTFREQLPMLTDDWSPNMRSAFNAVKTPDGWALRSWKGEREQAIGESEDSVIELDVRDDGGIRFYSARATGFTGALHVVFDAAVYGNLWRVIDAAAEIARQSGFVGNWQFGVALTGIRGAISHEWERRNWRGNSVAYANDEYIASVEVTFAELAGDYEPILRKLTDKLNRTLTEGRATLPTRRP
jgi:hypothetical protein